MVQLNLNDFSNEYKDIAPKELSCLLTNCLSEEDNMKLKAAWNNIGGYKVIPWWEWVLKNINISLDENLLLEEEYDNEK